jgi:hypothetical protein
LALTVSELLLSGLPEVLPLSVLPPQAASAINRVSARNDASSFFIFSAPFGFGLLFTNCPALPRRTN